jgi:hypothetical protein
MRRFDCILILFIENPSRQKNPQATALRLRSHAATNNPRCFHHVMQRPTMCAKRGDEIGENDPSHPTGIFCGFADCSCVLSPRRATLGAPGIGNRSPLNCRLTEKLGALAAMPAPTVGSAKNGITPTKNRASAVTPSAPAMRTNTLAIGLLRSADATTPAIDHAHENPPS